MINGIFILDKEGGMTSQTAVRRVQRLLGADKAGHTGTLDPMATGVLPILLGRAVKASEYLLTGNKHYTATLLLGLSTDTEDVTGTPLATSDSIPDEEAVTSALAAFRGEIMQTPPMYSALKVGGKKLCDIARAGGVVEREARPVTVFSLGAKRLSEREYSLDVVCSKGTYIRTLCADIGEALGCHGCMSTLRREEAAGFTVRDALTITELEAMTSEEREARVLPTEYIFRSRGAVTLPDFYARLARCGAEIYLKKIGVSAEAGELLRLYDARGFFALGEVREYPDGAAIKPVRQFDI